MKLTIMIGLLIILIIIGWNVIKKILKGLALILNLLHFNKREAQLEEQRKNNIKRLQDLGVSVLSEDKKGSLNTILFESHVIDDTKHIRDLKDSILTDDKTESSTSSKQNLWKTF
ncbi:hypothetical protein [Virgibacillus halodenitrificans]|uniref:hypothetical protein n=1 Tax=Virgibacillus halodenitrificans TaxID=1482 RepID=UPI000EF4439D|nr:hypothetical protein [Virgibacillus halodenitrificans]